MSKSPEQYNQSEGVWSKKDADRKGEIIEEMKSKGWGNPEFVIADKERTAKYLKGLEDVIRSVGVKEVQTGLEEYFPSDYHPFAPDGPRRPRELTQEEKLKYAQAISDASIESIRESSWSVLQLNGSDMDIRDYAIATSELEGLINKCLAEKGVLDKRVVRVHSYPMGRQTTGSRPWSSESGLLIIEAGEEKEKEA